MPVQPIAVIVYALAIGLIFLLGKLLLVPMKVLGKLLINAVLGGVMLLVLNAAGGFLDLRIAINPLTALITGVFGIPGVILLLVLQMIML